MRFITEMTTASGFSYEVTLPQFESFAEAEDVIEQGTEGIVQILNAAQKQNARQGPKKAVREAVDALEAELEGTKYMPAADHIQAWHDGEADVPEEYAEGIEELREAVRNAQETSEEYRLGTPRSEGLTKTASQKIGAALKERMGDDELLALAQEHGIDPADL